MNIKFIKQVYKNIAQCFSVDIFQFCDVLAQNHVNTWLPGDYSAVDEALFDYTGWFDCYTAIQT